MSSLFREHVSNPAADQTIASIASKTTYGGSATAVGGWALSSEAGVLFGVLLGVAGLCVNWYYKHRSDKRHEAEHNQRMAALSVMAMDDTLSNGLPQHKGD
jgi:hypothetical protein